MRFPSVDEHRLGRGKLFSFGSTEVNGSPQFAYVSLFSRSLFFYLFFFTLKLLTEKTRIKLPDFTFWVTADGEERLGRDSSASRGPRSCTSFPFSICHLYFPSTWMEEVRKTCVFLRTLRMQAPEVGRHTQGGKRLGTAGLTKGGREKTPGTGKCIEKGYPPLFILYRTGRGSSRIWKEP